jgi:hypothetical protein
VRFRNPSHLGPPRCRCIDDAATSPLRYLLVLTAPVILFSLAAAIQTAAATSEAQRDAWVVQASAGLSPAVIDTLHRIAGVNRQLLALRSYLRAGAGLTARWSWTEDRLSAYPSTPEGKAAAHEIDTVASAFATANPGFTLQVNRQPRSLDLQLIRWNENESVAKTAAALVAALGRRFTAQSPPPNATGLREALIEWSTKPLAALAAPGLSAHGQGRAFDFQVAHHGHVIAGVDVASAHRQWDAAGWTQKLHAAFSVAGNRFIGPLQSPYEPWHYTYTPAPESSAPKAFWNELLR